VTGLQNCQFCLISFSVSPHTQNISFAGNRLLPSLDCQKSLGPDTSPSKHKNRSFLVCRFSRLNHLSKSPAALLSTTEIFQDTQPHLCLPSIVVSSQTAVAGLGFKQILS